MISETWRQCADFVLCEVISLPQSGIQRRVLFLTVSLLLLVRRFFFFFLKCVNTKTLQKCNPIFTCSQLNGLHHAGVHKPLFFFFHTRVTGKEGLHSSFVLLFWFARSSPLDTGSLSLLFFLTPCNWPKVPSLSTAGLQSNWAPLEKLHPLSLLPIRHYGSTSSLSASTYSTKTHLLHSSHLIMPEEEESSPTKLLSSIFFFF